MDTIKEQFTLTAEDGYPLAITQFLPIHRQVTHSIQLNPATGVKQTFYYAFATYLASLGCQVFVLDYRGVGRSKPARLKGFSTTMLDWGRLDMNALTRHIVEGYPDIPLIWVGHSIGGQLAGISPFAAKITRVIAISTSTGYWRRFTFPYNWLSLFLWRVYLPIGTRLLGYAPTRYYGLGENLPAGVGRQWADWCLNADHFRDTLIAETGKPDFSGFTVPLTVICASDDYITRPANIQRFCDFYPDARVRQVLLSPATKTDPPIGHVGLFRSAMKDRYWPLLVAHILGETDE
jgi:predicted alpha/beta hydrolase